MFNFCSGQKNAQSYQKVYDRAKSIFIHIAPSCGKHLLKIYKYRVSILRVHSKNQKIKIFKECLKVSCFNAKKVFFYPEPPMPFCVIYKILIFLGIRIETDPEKKCDLAIQYWHGFDGNPFSPVVNFPVIKKSGHYAANVINLNCKDISKNRVNAAFEETFKYSIRVDPHIHIGKCVKKLNWNALHKGQIIECPTDTVDGDFVYQKLINNSTDDGYVKDMRVPVYRSNIPFVYLKYRSLKNRFIDRAHTNTKATIAEVDEVLSATEVTTIYQFCDNIGMDYGELDVLRDKLDGRIYIVDANIAPSGPPSPISKEEEKVAVIRLAKTFKEVFML